MTISFKKINKSIDWFLEKSVKIRNSKLRTSILVALYIIATIALFGVLPFIFGIYLILVINENINNNKLKYGLAATVSVIMLLIGIPWAGATYGRSSISQEAAPSNTKTETVTDKPAQKEAKPNIQIKQETVPEEIAFDTQTQEDATLIKGTTKVSQEGKNGLKEKVYSVTYTDGVETARELISENTVTQPVNKIVFSGTKVTTSTTTTIPTTPTTSTGNGYTNVNGNHIDSPSSNPAGATAKCKDGTYSKSQNHSGTCSHHGGVAEWL